MKKVSVLFTVLFSMLLFMGCESKEKNVFEPHDVAFNLRLLDKYGDDMPENNSIWWDHLFESYEVVSYRGNDIQITATGNDWDIKLYPLVHSHDDVVENIFGLRFICYDVNSEDMEPFDRSVAKIVSKQIFGDSQEHVIEVQWNTSGSTFEWEADEIRIDGEVYQTEILEHSHTDVPVASYRR